MSKQRVFLSYDREHDEDLAQRLLEMASTSASGFAIVARSFERGAHDVWDHELRNRVRGVDEMIVLCGEHTGESLRVSAELRIAQEEKRPYMLLWGRREIMCQKPLAAKPGDAMYGLSLEIIQDQILVQQRVMRENERLARAQLEKAARAK